MYSWKIPKWVIYNDQLERFASSLCSTSEIVGMRCMDTYNVPQKSYQSIGCFYAREVNPFLPKGFPIDE